MFLCCALCLSPKVKCKLEPIWIHYIFICLHVKWKSLVNWTDHLWICLEYVLQPFSCVALPLWRADWVIEKQMLPHRERTYFSEHSVFWGGTKGEALGMLTCTSCEVNACIVLGFWHLFCIRISRLLLVFSITFKLRSFLKDHNCQIWGSVVFNDNG